MYMYLIQICLHIEEPSFVFVKGTPPGSFEDTGCRCRARGWISIKLLEVQVVNNAATDDGASSGFLDARSDWVVRRGSEDKAETRREMS